MSQKLITIDDHTGDVITDQPAATRGAVILARNDHSLTWPDVNMTDESWDGLIKLIRDYLPDAEPEATEGGTDDADVPKKLSEHTLSDYVAQRDAERATTTAPNAPWHDAPQGGNKTSDTQLETRSATGEMTQAQRKARSAAIRAWYYALDAASLKALGLKTPDRSVTLGKLSPAVVAAYEQSH